MSSLYKQTQHKRRVTMFSFPRSGSNWISYCIEQVSGLAVIGSDSHIGGVDVEERVKRDPKAVVHKTHGGNEIWGIFDNNNNHNEGLLLIIRNYKESILRDAKNKPNYPQIHPIEDMKSSLIGLSNNTTSPDYLKMIQKYHKYDGPKLLIDYDDFILNPKVELIKIHEWLKQFGGDVNTDKLTDMINNFDKHRSFSMRRYINMHGTTATDGDPKKLKIQKETWLNDVTETEIDDYVKNRDPLIFEKYLKRYKL